MSCEVHWDCGIVEKSGCGEVDLMCCGQIHGKCRCKIRWGGRGEVRCIGRVGERIFKVYERIMRCEDGVRIVVC